MSQHYINHFVLTFDARRSKAQTPSTKLQFITLPSRSLHNFTMDHLFSAGKDFLERQNKDDDKGSWIVP